MKAAPLSPDYPDQGRPYLRIARTCFAHSQMPLAAGTDGGNGCSGRWMRAGRGTTQAEGGSWSTTRQRHPLALRPCVTNTHAIPPLQLHRSSPGGPTAAAPQRATVPRNHQRTAATLPSPGWPALESCPSSDVAASNARCPARVVAAAVGAWAHRRGEWRGGGHECQALHACEAGTPRSQCSRLLLNGTLACIEQPACTP